jgi:serine/threonine protein phosphatase 1
VWRKLTSRTARRSPRLPHGLRIYAVGDIHGRVDLLDQVFSRIDTDLATYPDCEALQIFLGDYIDRGPASSAVLDRLVARSDTHQIICLKGNHESYMLEFLQNPAVLPEWRHLGGLETLISYGLKPSINADPAEQIDLSKTLNAVLPRRHRSFLETLTPSFACPEFLSSVRTSGICFGSATTFSYARRTTGRSLCTATHRFSRQKYGRTESTSTPALMPLGD